MYLVHLKLRKAQETKLVTKQTTASQFKARQMITEFHFTLYSLMFVADFAMHRSPEY